VEDESHYIMRYFTIYTLRQFPILFGQLNQEGYVRRTIDGWAIIERISHESDERIRTG
jgi:hypothetical protein